MSLFLYDSVSGCKRRFVPIGESGVGLYVCGPTVYSNPHIGNVRSVVVYDILYRILKMLYPKVVYVRNVTDVDDKIIAESERIGISIHELTTRHYKVFREDLKKMFCMQPDFEPMATDHIDDMIKMINILLERGNAYINSLGVYFRVASYPDYGVLSRREVEDMITGTRVDHSGKMETNDFVLWKLDEVYGWDSPWGKGRPGWHIECSAMSTRYLGDDFDIHGGGADLKFPHHENEIAQSRCTHPGSKFANYWVHNGFVTVNGEKMSKSKGNQLDLNALLACHHAEVIRYTLLGSHYRKPIDWNDDVLRQSYLILDKFYRMLKINEQHLVDLCDNPGGDFVKALLDDMNIPECLGILHSMCATISTESDPIMKKKLLGAFKANCGVLGILSSSTDEWFGVDDGFCASEVERLLSERADAKSKRDYERADAIRDFLLKRGIEVMDAPGGSAWRYSRRVD